MPTETTNYELVETGDSGFVDVKPEEASENRAMWNDIVRLLRRADKLNYKRWTLEDDLAASDDDSKFFFCLTFHYFVVFIDIPYTDHLFHS